MGDDPARMMREDDRLNVPFVDILFGLAISEIFVALASSDGFTKVPIAGYSHLFLAAAVIVLSWIGYHLARNEHTWVPTFFNLAFAQFLVDILILSDYFLLVTLVEGIPGLGSKHARPQSAVPETVLIAIAFVLYLAWDVLEVRIRTRQLGGTSREVVAARAKARARRAVTSSFAVALAVMAVIVAAKNPTSDAHVITIDAVLLVVLVVYRIVGHRSAERAGRRGPVPLPEPVISCMHMPAFAGALPVEVLETAGRQGADDLLMQLVSPARDLARPTISGYAAGAAVLGGSGHVYLGANLEVTNGTLADTVHAEQSATMNAWLHGEQSLAAIALSAPPCGQCRQFLLETVDGGSIRVLTPDQPARALSDLLPGAFGSDHLSGGHALLRQASRGLQLAAAPTDPVVAAALVAADQSYAPYTGTYAGVAIETDRGVFAGRYAENVAFNPSVGPFVAALAMTALARVVPTGFRRVVLVHTNGPVDHATHTRALLRGVAACPLEVHLAGRAP